MHGLRGLTRRGLLTNRGGKFRLPYSLDFSTLADGALPRWFNNALWAISGGAAVGTPTPGAELIVNGGMDADSDWTKGAGWTIGAGVSTKAAGTQSQLYQAVLTASKFYVAQADITRTAGNFYLMFGTSAYGPVIQASGTYKHSYWASSNRAAVWGATADAAGTADNVSYKLVTLENCSALLNTKFTYGQTKTSFTVPDGIAAGLWMCVDNPANILNGILAVIGEGRGIRLLKLVNGTFTQLLNGPAVYVDGHTLEIRRAAGTDVFQVFYDNVQMGADQTVAGMTGTYHGLFSTDPSAEFSNYFFHNLIAQPPTINLLLLGDSKTVALGAVADQFYAFLHTFSETPTRIAQVGWKADELAAALPAALAAAVGTPDHVLINIGANDVAAGRTEEEYKTGVRSIVEQLHAKYPAASIGLAKPVILAGDPPNVPLPGVATLHGWIDDLITEYAYCFEGPDETGMENGDDYVTYLVDLTHNTAAGKQWVADHWVNAVGY